MRLIIFLSLFLSVLIFSSCTDPDLIGIEVQPLSETIIMSDTSSVAWQSSITNSGDSILSKNLINLVLGEITDPVFGYNQGSFYNQIELSQNNNILGENPQVDSVILSYTYSGYYGDLDEFIDLEVNRIFEDLNEDSSYYSNTFSIAPGSTSWVESFSLSNDSLSPFLRVKLLNSFGQEILNMGDEMLQDNSVFLEEFKGISMLARASNTMLYLNPLGTNTFLKIYYHNDDSGSDTLSLDFNMGGVRVSLFNNKSDNLENEVLLSDDENIYIQSMVGYRSTISILNKDSLKNLLDGKTINKVIMRLDVNSGSQVDYKPHERLFLVRLDENGDRFFLTDYTIEGESHFDGYLNNDRYSFNITRYFYQFLNNSSYTDKLYLTPSGDGINASRTILEKDIILEIYYSQL